jgi:group I intron endonuclease
MRSGVYYICNRYTNRLYIGQSDDVLGRFDQHCRDLQRRGHHNKALQADWNDFGSLAFTFDLIVPENDSRRRCKVEQLFIRVYQTDDPRLGYNIYANHWAINHQKRVRP